MNDKQISGSSASDKIDKSLSEPNEVPRIIVCTIPDENSKIYKPDFMSLSPDTQPRPYALTDSPVFYDLLAIEKFVRFEAEKLAKRQWHPKIHFTSRDTQNLWDECINQVLANHDAMNNLIEGVVNLDNVSAVDNATLLILAKRLVKGDRNLPADVTCGKMRAAIRALIRVVFTGWYRGELLDA